MSRRTTAFCVVGKCGYENEVFNNGCSNACQEKCENNANDFCPEYCQLNSCTCKAGFCRDKTGNCIRAKTCNKSCEYNSTCIENAPMNQATCDNYKEFKDTRGTFKPGCVCKEGFVLVSESRPQCVLISDCEKFRKCGSILESYVEQCPINRCKEECPTEGIDKLCTEECGKCGCYCDKGYCRNENKVCVRLPEVNQIECDVTCDNYKDYEHLNWGHKRKQRKQCPDGSVCISNDKFGTKSEVAQYRSRIPCVRDCNPPFKLTCPMIKCAIIKPAVCECAENYCDKDNKCVPIRRMKKEDNCKMAANVEVSADNVIN
ncbi:Zonadhesin-like protein [Leptotrombidium deliense]|uniref:Zonadhesin-like protein n=1 Tax=Leptotrombidium deliense TaxID=299467 RepID=A0A443S1D0_9ACAR|nr:Zonadhesin-like protein [Leptotrombidium deliense]